MQGVFYRRPSGALDRLPTKKSLKDQATAHPETIVLEATSVFGNEYGGDALEMPEGVDVTIVGPDPHTKRSWYATISRSGLRLTVS
jgi:hypothetical protein